MRSCPRCNVNFPPGIVVCPNDGVRLVAEPHDRPAPSIVDPTESLAVPSRGGREPVDPTASLARGTGTRPDNATRAERPIARDPTPMSARRTGPTRKRSRRPSTPEERIGRVLGNYRLTRLLGRGGMGCVYEAEHIKLGRHVALKLLRADHSERRDAVARFFHEARSVNKIRHRNIVDVTDFVELPDGPTFIIMELLEGQSLRMLMRAPGLEAPRALALLIQICDGLAAAHATGIVHRDLKPDNIFVVPTGDGAELAKLLDFGVAKLLYREDSEDFGFETAAGAVIGTPTFMSPEQAGGLEVDHRSDLYSLGAIMYEMFCGVPIFRGKSFGEFVRKHLNERPTPPSQTRGGQLIDDRLEVIIMRCLEKNPDNRYADSMALREELLVLLGCIETVIPVVSELSRSGPYSASEVGAELLQTTPDQAGGRGRAASAPIAAETAMALGDLPATRTSGSTPTRPLLLGGIALLAVAAMAAMFFLTRGSGINNTDRADDVAVREHRAKPTAPTPEVTAVPVGSDDGRPTNAAVTVRFLSTPAGDVSARGSGGTICTTPCDITIDPDDGGSPNARDFLIKRRGFEPEAVRIDLRSPPRNLSFRLRKRGQRPARVGAKPPVSVAKPPVPVVEVETARTDKRGSDKVKADEDPKKKGGPIGPAQTLDPFHRK